MEPQIRRPGCKDVFGFSAVREMSAPTPLFFKDQLCNLEKPAQLETENLNIPVTIKRVKQSYKKTPQPHNLISNFYQIFSEEVTPMSYNLSG